MATLLYVGETGQGTTSEMRIRALREIGFTVNSGCERPRQSFPRAYPLIQAAFIRLRRPLDTAGDNKRLVRDACGTDVVWIDKGNHIRPSTLRALCGLSNRPLVIGYSCDDMAARHNNSIWFLQGLPFYDGFITTKSYGVSELLALGCRHVAFVDNAYDPATHRPMPLEDPATARYACQVGFVGSYEDERAELIDFVARSGIRVVVRGNGWEPIAKRHAPGIQIFPPVYGDDYARCVSATQVNLSFLRKINRDVQTTRTVEIPACGGFMLAERTDEHRRLFREGIEAEYFEGPQELLAKIRYYLEHHTARNCIAAAGRARCVSNDYSYAARLREGLRNLGIDPRTPLAPRINSRRDDQQPFGRLLQQKAESSRT